MIKYLNADPFILGAIRKPHVVWTIEDKARYLKILVRRITYLRNVWDREQRYLTEHDYYIGKRAIECLDMMSMDTSKYSFYMHLDILSNVDMIGDVVVSCMSNDMFAKWIKDLAVEDPAHLNSLMKDNLFSRIVLMV